MSIVIDKNVKEEDRELCRKCREACNPGKEFGSSLLECRAYIDAVTGMMSTCEQARTNQTCVRFGKKEINHE